MKVAVELDLDVVQRMEDASARLGVTFEELVVRLVATVDRSSTVESRISRLHAIGWCDADIARELRYSIGQVAKLRRRLGLPPNRRYRSASK